MLYIFVALITFGGGMQGEFSMLTRTTPMSQAMCMELKDATVAEVVKSPMTEIKIAECRHVREA